MRSEYSVVGEISFCRDLDQTAGLDPASQNSSEVLRSEVLTLHHHYVPPLDGLPADVLHLELDHLPLVATCLALGETLAVEMTEEDVTGGDLLRPGDGARFIIGWNYNSYLMKPYSSSFFQVMILPMNL